MVIGIDEVGRGAWAGPLVFAAVMLPAGFQYYDLLDDSKKLSRSQRADLYEKIIVSAPYAIAEIPNTEIDSTNLTLCSMKACHELIDNLNPEEDVQIILDGNVNYLKNHRLDHLVSTMIKADEKIPEVMAASIVAKHYRDNLMYQYDKEYPGYDFDSHVGYGTAGHREALAKFGITKIHRTSYKPIKDLL